jgi:hypothetical protein
MANLMEKGGTGGALFRNLYRDFLKESYNLLQFEKLNEAQVMLTGIARLWTHVSGLFEKVAETKKTDYVYQASRILVTLSQRKRQAMELLSSL